MCSWGWSRDVEKSFAVQRVLDVPIAINTSRTLKLSHIVRSCTVEFLSFARMKAADGSGNSFFKVYPWAFLSTFFFSPPKKRVSYRIGGDFFGKIQGFEEKFQAPFLAAASYAVISKSLSRFSFNLKIGSSVTLLTPKLRSIESYLINFDC